MSSLCQSEPLQHSRETCDQQNRDDETVSIDEEDQHESASQDDRECGSQEQDQLQCKFTFTLSRDLLQFKILPRQRHRCVKTLKPYQNYVRTPFRFEVWSKKDEIVSTFLLPLSAGNHKRPPSAPKFNHTKQMWIISFLGPVDSQTIVVTHDKMHPIRINL